MNQAGVVDYFSLHLAYITSYSTSQKRMKKMLQEACARKIDHQVLTFFVILSTFLSMSLTATCRQKIARWKIEVSIVLSNWDGS
jgi:uncharacterized membrane protein (GlpM family)